MMGCCLILPVLYILLLIASCLGYDRTLDFDDGDCDSYEFYDLTQYESYLIKWDGKKLGTYSTCNTNFHGENDDNVITDYRVCFKTIDQFFDNCDIKVHFIEGVSEDGNEYDCSTSIPETWCTEHDTSAHLKIVARSNTNSRLRIEVTVTAGVSLSVGAAVGITFAILAFLGIATTVIIILVCRKYRKAPSKGRVIRAPGDPPSSNNQDQQLVGYPTQQIQMVPAGQGRYRPVEVTTQQNIIVPSNVQPHVLYPSQTDATSPVVQSSYTHNENQQHNNQQSSDSTNRSVPPPSYNSYM